MSILSTIIYILILGIFSFGCFLFYRLYKRYTDLQKFVLDLNDDINDFRKSVDVLTTSHIMVYDEIVFDVVDKCKEMKNKIDNYLLRYEDLENYSYVEEKEEQKEFLGLIRPGASTIREK